MTAKKHNAFLVKDQCAKFFAQAMAIMTNIDQNGRQNRVGVLVAASLPGAPACVVPTFSSTPVEDEDDSMGFGLPAPDSPQLPTQVP
eukprot:526935-Amphidinium_carterae.1